MKKQIFLILALILITGNVYSQEIKANVTVNMEQIDFESRMFITSLKFDLENYINNQSFSGIEWEGTRIPVEISIFFTGANRTMFSAQMVIISKRTIRGTDDEGQSIATRFLDKEWAFEYQSGAILSYNPMRYNEFTSLIDLYMLLIVANDLDTYEELGGSKVYDDAKEIAMMASSLNKNGFSTNFAPGEMTRYSMISEMTDPRYETFRRLIFGYYVDGLDMMVEDANTGKANLTTTIHNMADFKKNKLAGPSTFLQLFYDAKAMELSQLFKGDAESPVWKDLMYLDPTNTMLYQEAKDGK